MPALAKLGMDVSHLTMISMIVAVAILVVMLPLLKDTSTEAEKSFTRAQCATSVRQQALANTYLPEGFASSLDCAPVEVKLTVQPEDQSTKQAAFRAIGDAMLSCWNDFGRGELNLFSAEGMYCNVCSYMEFDPNHPVKQFAGLNQFLATSRPPAQTITYLEQLAGVETDQFKELFDDPSLLRANNVDLPDAVSTDKLYSTIFVYAKGEGAFNQLRDAMGRDKVLVAGGATTLAVAGGAVLLLSGPIGWTAALLVGAGVATAGLGGTVWAALEDDPPAWLAFVAFGEHEPEKLAKLGCGPSRA